MEFDYYYGMEAEQFPFYRIPRTLVNSWAVICVGGGMHPTVSIPAGNEQSQQSWLCAVLVAGALI